MFSDGVFTGVVSRQHQGEVVRKQIPQELEIAHSSFNVLGGIECVGHTKPLAVAGSNCMIPWAPLREIALGL